MTQDEEGRAPATIALLPCPFCGGEASADGVTRYSKHHEVWFADGTQCREAFFVNCVKCGIRNDGMVGHQTRDNAIAAWNTRPPAEAQAKLREALERAVSDIADLIAESEGVYGLHQNGDPSPWSELLAGGRFEDWLGSLDAAFAALRDTQP